MPDWNRPLTRPVQVRDGPTLTTLAQARAFILKQPERPPWPNCAGVFLNAANTGSKGDILTATQALEDALFIDGLRLKL